MSDSTPPPVPPEVPPQIPPDAAQNPYQKPRNPHVQTARPPSTDSWQSVIPTKNAPALVAYYAGVFSLVPCFALIVGLVAIGFGIKGLKLIKEDPEMPGKGHAIIGIVLGSLSFLANVAGIILLSTMGGD